MGEYLCDVGSEKRIRHQDLRCVGRVALALFFSFAQDADDADADSDEEKDRKDDVVDERIGAHEEIDLWHAEESENEAHEEEC